jgi:hypothetical protein
MIANPASISKIKNQKPVRRSFSEVGSSIVNPPFASKYRTVLPSEGESERRVIERIQNGGDILASEP